MSGRWALAALPFALAGLLSAAADERTGPSCAGSPSSFDYLVLASIADSQHPISMLDYRPRGRNQK
jgi:hypothetical protein